MQGDQSVVVALAGENGLHPDSVRVHGAEINEYAAMTMMASEGVALVPADDALRSSSARFERSAGPDVLLVENDAFVRQCLAEMLDDAGLRVVAASSAEEAMASARLIGPWAVLVTDLHLGSGLDGIGLIAALRQRRPDIGAVLISGGPVAGGALDRRDAFLPKPFQTRDLLRAVERVRSEASGLAEGRTVARE